MSSSSITSATGTHRRRDRRVVQRQDRAVLGRRGEHVAQPGQLVVGQLAVVPAGDAGVEADDPQAGDVVHAVLRRLRLLAEQLAGVRRRARRGCPCTTRPVRRSARPAARPARAAAGTPRGRRGRRGRRSRTSACGGGSIRPTRSSAASNRATVSIASYCRASPARRWVSLTWARTWVGGASWPYWITEARVLPHSRAGSTRPATSPRVIRPPPVPGAE